VGIRPVMVTTPEPFLVLSAAQQAQPDYIAVHKPQK
jgi:hypothetical protein